MVCLVTGCPSLDVGTDVILLPYSDDFVQMAEES